MPAAWAMEEMDQAIFEDERLNARLTKLLSDLGERPQLSIPAACGGHAETAAAYRFFDNESVTQDLVLQPISRKRGNGCPSIPWSCSCKIRRNWTSRDQQYELSCSSLVQLRIARLPAISASRTTRRNSGDLPRRWPPCRPTCLCCRRLNRTSRRLTLTGQQRT